MGLPAAPTDSAEQVPVEQLAQAPLQAMLQQKPSEQMPVVH